MKQKTLLFNPGPTNVPPEVRNALITPDMSHRDPLFKEVMVRVNNNIVKVLGGNDQHSAVFFTSSGTGANEAMINGIHGKILVILHGRYSERLAEIAKRFRIPTVEFCIPELEMLDLALLENHLKQDPEITHILMVHHETTTAVVEPLKEIGAICKRYNKILVVDAISSIGAHSLNLEECNIGLCSLNGNKGLEGLPGISFVIGKNKIFQDLKGKARSFYFDLNYQWECQVKLQKMPYTAAVQTVFALDAAIKKLLLEGYCSRILRYRKLACTMREGLRKLGFKLIEHPPERQSNILTLMEIPEKFNYYLIRDALKKLNITIYTDKNTLANGRMFIANMGNLKEDEIEFFLKKLKEAIKDNECVKAGYNIDSQQEE